MDIFGVTVNCGSIIISECKDHNMPWGDDWAFQALLGELLDATGNLMNVGLAALGGVSPNIVRAVNALRCAIVNVGDNAWNLVAAVYWTLVGVGQEATAREYLDQGYEWICTCVQDGQKLIEAMGVDTSNENSQYSNACSESAAVAQEDAATQRERDKQAELDAQAEAERVAEEEAQAQLAREALVGRTAAELEAAQLSAFESYQAKAEEIASKPDAEVTVEDREELEQLRREYEAMQTASSNIIRDGLSKKLWDAKDESGIDGLRNIVAEASLTQLDLAKKSQEFPEDTQIQDQYSAAETEMRLLRDELLVMSESTDVSTREAAGILGISIEAKSVEAYNRLYAEALPIARNTPDDLLFFFDAIEDTLRAAEREWNYASANGSPVLGQLEIEFNEALNDFEAGLKVRFDVDEKVSSEALLPEVVLTEDDADALNFPVDSARNVVGGQSDVDFWLKQVFDQMLELENILAEDPQNPQLRASYATARKHYQVTKERAISTGPQQLGFSPEEIAAAQKIADGDTGPVTVELDNSIAEQLEAEMKAQREEEARLKQEAVDAAEAELQAKQAEAARLAAEQEAAAAALAAANAEAEKAAELKRLLEEYEAQQAAQSSETTTTRRRLQTADTTTGTATTVVEQSEAEASCQASLGIPDLADNSILNLDYCQTQFMAGVFDPVLMGFVQCVNSYAETKQAEALAAQQQAEADAKAAAEAQRAAEDAVTDAYVAPVVVSGQTPQEKIDQYKKDLAKITQSIKKEKDAAAKALLQEEQVTIASTLKYLEDTLVAIREAEKEANPELYQKQQEAEERAARLEEQRNALTTEQISQLTQQLNEAIEQGIVQELMTDFFNQKKAASEAYQADPTNTTLEEAQETLGKMFTEIQSQYKIIQDQEAAAVREAQAERQAKIDAARNVPLTDEDTQAIQAQILEIVSFERTGDPETDAATLKQKLDGATAFRFEVRQEMKRLEEIFSNAQTATYVENDNDAYAQYLDNLASAQHNYYYEKSKVDLITTMISTTQDQAKAAQEALDAARLRGDLSARDRSDLELAIERINSITNALDQPDDARIYQSLANYENKLQYEMEQQYKNLGEDSTDTEKRAYYRAQNEYEFVSNLLGDQSPAKVLSRQAAIDAANKAALIKLTEDIGRSTGLQQVMGFLRDASNNTSPIPDMLSDAGDPENVSAVLLIVQENEDFARTLAMQLLQATSTDVVGNAFAKIQEEWTIANSNGDQEAIIVARIDSLINESINNAQLSVGTIVKAFNTDAALSETEDELMTAYRTGETSVLNTIQQIEGNMSRNVLALAPGFDLTAASTVLDTIMQEAQVEAQLNLEKERSKFDAKFIRNNFNAQLALAETEAAVNEALAEISSWRDEKVTSLSSTLNNIISQAAQNPALADRQQEARTYSDFIIEGAQVAFDAAYANAEVSASARVTEFQLAILARNTRDAFERTTTKDEVDNQYTRSQTDLDNTYSYRLYQLNSTVSFHELEGTESITALRNSMDRDYELASAQIVSLADNRRAQLDRQAAEAAQNAQQIVAQRVTDAGMSIAAYKAELQFYEQQITTLSSDLRPAKQLEIDTVKARISEQEAVKLEAETEVVRLTEAADNARQLQTLAEEIANAKDKTDQVIISLIDAKDKLQLELATLQTEENQLLDNIEGLQYQLRNASDSSMTSDLERQISAANTQYEAAIQSQINKRNLEEQYDSNIRQIFNEFRVTKAVISSQVVNAEVMVAIKNQMNAREDLTAIPDKIATLRGLISTLGDDDGAYTTQIEDLEYNQINLPGYIEELEAEIERKSEEQTVRNATALTIEAQIANEEALLRLDLANEQLLEYQLKSRGYANDIKEQTIFQQLGNENAAANITRIQGLQDGVQALIDELLTNITGIERARDQAQQSFEIANALAQGTTDSIQSVVDRAPALIEEFKADYDLAMTSQDQLQTDFDILQTKITTISNMTLDLTNAADQKQIENSTKYTVQAASTLLKLNAAKDKVAGFNTALVTTQKAYQRAQEALANSTLSREEIYAQTQAAAAAAKEEAAAREAKLKEQENAQKRIAQEAADKAEKQRLAAEEEKRQEELRIASRAAEQAALEAAGLGNAISELQRQIDEHEAGTIELLASDLFYIRQNLARLISQKAEIDAEKTRQAELLKEQQLKAQQDAAAAEQKLARQQQEKEAREEEERLVAEANAAAELAARLVEEETERQRVYNEELRVYNENVASYNKIQTQLAQVEEGSTQYTNLFKQMMSLAGQIFSGDELQRMEQERQAEIERAAAEKARQDARDARAAEEAAALLAADNETKIVLLEEQLDSWNVQVEETFVQIDQLWETFDEQRVYQEPYVDEAGVLIEDLTYYDDVDVYFQDNILEYDELLWNEETGLFSRIDTANAQLVNLRAVIAADAEQKQAKIDRDAAAALNQKLAAEAAAAEAAAAEKLAAEIAAAERLAEEQRLAAEAQARAEAEAAILAEQMATVDVNSAEYQAVRQEFIAGEINKNISNVRILIDETFQSRYDTFKTERDNRKEQAGEYRIQQEEQRNFLLVEWESLNRQLEDLYTRGLELEQALNKATNLERWVAATQEIEALEVKYSELQLEAGQKHIEGRRIDLALNFSSEELAIMDIQSEIQTRTTYKTDLQTQITSLTPNLTASGEDSDVTQAVATATIALLNEQIADQDIKIAELQGEFTNRRREQDIKIGTNSERISIEELEFSSSKLMNDTHVDEMVLRYWEQNQDSIRQPFLEDEQTLDEIEMSVTRFEADLAVKIANRDRVQTQINNQWTAFDRKEENNQYRLAIQEMKDKLATDQTDLTNQQGELTRLTALYEATTVVSDRDAYQWEIFLATNEIDTIQDRMTEVQNNLTEIESQYATRLEEQELQQQIDTLWQEYTQFTNSADGNRSKIALWKLELEALVAGDADYVKISTRIAEAQESMRLAEQKANEKYDAIMVIEDQRIQKEKEANAKAQDAELAKAKEEVQRNLTEAEIQVTRQVGQVDFLNAKYTNPQDFNLTVDDRPAIQEEIDAAETTLTDLNKAVNNLKGDLARAEQAAQQAKQVRQDMEALDALYKQLAKAWRKIQSVDDQIWEIDNEAQVILDEMNPRLQEWQSYIDDAEANSMPVDEEWQTQIDLIHAEYHDQFEQIDNRRNDLMTAQYVTDKAAYDKIQTDIDALYQAQTQRELAAETARQEQEEREKAESADREKLEIVFRQLELTLIIDDATSTAEQRAEAQTQLDKYSAQDAALQLQKEEAERVLEIKRLDQIAIVEQQKTQQTILRSAEREERQFYIDDARTWAADSQKWLDDSTERLAFYQFKQTLLKANLDTMEADETLDRESEEYLDLKHEVEMTKGNIREIQLYIGWDKQSVQQANNHLQSLINEDLRIMNENEFLDENAELIQELQDQEAIWNTKQNDRRQFELQIITLEDLIYEIIGNDREEALTIAINERIDQLKEDIVAAELDIEEAQDILNEIAARQLVITQQRQVDALAAAKESALIDARSDMQWYESLVQDYEQRLNDLFSDQEEQSAQEPVAGTLQTCEPSFLYSLDEATLMPQVSEVAVDIINGFYITGDITPDDAQMGIFPDYIDAPHDQVWSLFTGEVIPAGFMDFQSQIPTPALDEYYASQTAATAIPGGAAGSATTGVVFESFTDRIADAMNNAVNQLREKAAFSIENMMIDIVKYGPDGAGVPCTTVECLLQASVEASRAYLLHQQMQTAAHDGMYHDDMYYDEAYYGEEKYPTTGDYGYEGGPGTYPNPTTGEFEGGAGTYPNPTTGEFEGGAGTYPNPTTGEFDKPATGDFDTTTGGFDTATGGFDKPTTGDFVDTTVTAADGTRFRRRLQEDPSTTGPSTTDGSDPSTTGPPTTDGSDPSTTGPPTTDGSDPSTTGPSGTSDPNGPPTAAEGEFDEFQEEEDGFAVAYRQMRDYFVGEEFNQQTMIQAYEIVLSYLESSGLDATQIEAWREETANAFATIPDITLDHLLVGVAEGWLGANGGVRGEPNQELLDSIPAIVDGLQQRLLQFETAPEDVFSAALQNMQFEILSLPGFSYMSMPLFGKIFELEGVQPTQTNITGFFTTLQRTLAIVAQGWTLPIPTSTEVPQEYLDMYTNMYNELGQFIVNVRADFEQAQTAQATKDMMEFYRSYMLEMGAPEEELSDERLAESNITLNSVGTFDADQLELLIAAFARNMMMAKGQQMQEQFKRETSLTDRGIEEYIRELETRMLEATTQDELILTVQYIGVTAMGIFGLTEEELSGFANFAMSNSTANVLEPQLGDVATIQELVALVRDFLYSLSAKTTQHENVIREPNQQVAEQMQDFLNNIRDHLQTFATDEELNAFFESEFSDQLLQIGVHSTEVFTNIWSGMYGERQASLADLEDIMYVLEQGLQMIAEGMQVKSMIDPQVLEQLDAFLINAQETLYAITTEDEFQQFMQGLGTYLQTEANLNSEDLMIFGELWQQLNLGEQPTLEYRDQFYHVLMEGAYTIAYMKTNPHANSDSGADMKAKIPELADKIRAGFNLPTPEQVEDYFNGQLIQDIMSLGVTQEELSGLGQAFYSMEGFDPSITPSMMTDEYKERVLWTIVDWLNEVAERASQKSSGDSIPHMIQQEIPYIVNDLRNQLNEAQPDQIADIISSVYYVLMEKGVPEEAMVRIGVVMQQYPGADRLQGSPDTWTMEDAEMFLSIFESAVYQVAQEYIDAERDEQYKPPITNQDFYDQAEETIIYLEQAFREVTTQEQLDEIIAALGPRLLDIGATQEENEAIYRLMVKSGIEIDINQPEMAGRFISILTHALEMIAYGQGEYISPSIESRVNELLQQTITGAQERFGETFTESIRQDVIEGLVSWLTDNMGVPASSVERLSGQFVTATSYEDLAEIIRPYFTQLYEIQERLEYDLTLRQMPDFGQVLDGLQKNIDVYQQIVGERLNAEYGIQLGLNEDDLRTIYEHGPKAFLDGGPNSVMGILDQMTEMTPENRQAAYEHIVDSLISAMSHVLRYTLVYREDDTRAIEAYTIYQIKQMSDYEGNGEFSDRDQLEMMNMLIDLGYTFYHREEAKEEQVSIPPLDAFVPRMIDGFSEYLRENLPQINPAQFTEPEIQRIIDLTVAWLTEETGPNIGAIIDYVQYQMNLPQDIIDMILDAMRGFFNGLIYEILAQSGLSGEQLESTAASMAYSFGTLSNEEYGYIMSAGFSSGANLDPISEFVNVHYEIPYELTEEISRLILEGSQEYLRNNLPEAGVTDEGRIAEFIELFSTEMRQERGPNFYKLPELYAAFDIPAEAIRVSMNEFQNFLERSLIDGVRHLDIDQSIRQVMAAAIKGALDYTFTDIANGSSGDGIPNFYDLIPMFGDVIGQIMREYLMSLSFMTESFADEIIREVGNQVTNPDGINFQAFMDLPDMIILEDNMMKVQILSVVGSSIAYGSEAAIFQLTLEEKYQDAAVRALRRELEATSKEFENFAYSSGLIEKPAPERWYPEPWTYEVCCMKGMSCWTDDFADQAAQDSLVKEIAEYRLQYENAKEHYNLLDADNQRELSEERATLLAESKNRTLKLTNQISDAIKNESELTTAIADMVEPELAAAQSRLTALQTSLQGLRDEKTENDQRFAEMEQVDAEYQVTTLTKEVEDRDAHISYLQSEAEYHSEQVEYYTQLQTDESLSEEDRDFAKQQVQENNDLFNEQSIEAVGQRTLNDAQNVELTAQRLRLKAANKFLQEAEDARAAKALADQTAAYETLKASYNQWTADLAALSTREAAGDIGEGDADFVTLLEMEYMQDEKLNEYTLAKAALDTATRERNDKAYNRAFNELSEAQYELAFALADTAEAKAVYDIQNEGRTALETQLTQVRANLTNSPNDDNLRSQKSDLEGQIRVASIQLGPVYAEWDRLAVISTAAQTAVDNATAALTVAQAAKDATDRKLAEERRQKIANDYKQATAQKDAATAALNEFRAEYSENEVFDETLIATEEQWDIYHELEIAFADADTQYNFAAIQIQSQLQEAAEAASLAAKMQLAEERAALETARIAALDEIMVNISAKDKSIATANATKQSAAESIEFAANDEERNELLSNLADAKISINQMQGELDELWTSYHATEERHYQERAAEAQTDANTKAKEEADRQFNEEATRVVTEYNEAVNEQQRFQNLLNQKQQEKDTLEAETDEEVLLANWSKIDLLGQYVDVYQQQVDLLQTSVDELRENFEIVSEQKRLREATEAALAAQKEKEAQFNDMRIEVEESRQAQIAQGDIVYTAQKALDAANTADPQVQGDIDAAQATFDEADELYTELKQQYNLAKELFDEINEERRIIEEEARARQLANQRNEIFEGVRNDITFFQTTYLAMEPREAMFLEKAQNAETVANSGDPEYLRHLASMAAIATAKTDEILNVATEAWAAIEQNQQDESAKAILNEAKSVYEQNKRDIRELTSVIEVLEGEKTQLVTDMETQSERVRAKSQTQLDALDSQINEFTADKTVLQGDVQTYDEERNSVANQFILDEIANKASIQSNIDNYQGQIDQQHAERDALWNAYYEADDAFYQAVNTVYESMTPQDWDAAVDQVKGPEAAPTQLAIAMDAAEQALNEFEASFGVLQAELDNYNAQMGHINYLEQILESGSEEQAHIDTLRDHYNDYVENNVNPLVENLTTAEASFENMSTSSVDYETTSASITSMTAQLSHFQERADQFKLDWERAVTRSTRTETRDYYTDKIDEAVAQLEYFHYVIDYFNQKLQWTNDIANSIQWDVEEEYQYWENTIRPQQDRIWELMDSLHSQLDDVNEEIQTLDFERFLFEFNNTEQDEIWVDQDIARQQKWVDDTNSHMENLQESMDALYVTDPTDDTLVYLPVESVELYDQYQSEWDSVRGYTDDLEYYLNQAIAFRAERLAEKLRLDEQRKADAAAEEARQQAEQEARAIEDRQRALADVEHSLTNIIEHREWIQSEMARLQSELKGADSKTRQAINASLESYAIELQDLANWEEDQRRYKAQLIQEEEDYTNWKAEEAIRLQQEQREAEEAMVETLEDEQETLATLLETMTSLEQELAADPSLQGDFDTAKKAYNEQKAKVTAIQKLATAQAEREAAEEAELLGSLQQARDNENRLVDIFTSAAIVWEEIRLEQNIPEAIRAEVKSSWEEAAADFSENQGLIRELAQRDARKKAQSEDMRDVRAARATARTAAQTAWDAADNQWRVAATDAETDRVTAQTALETARAALTTANTAVATATQLYNDRDQSVADGDTEYDLTLADGTVHTAVTNNGLFLAQTDAEDDQGAAATAVTDAEQALTDATTARDEAVATFAAEAAHELDMRDENELMAAYDTLWGREAIEGVAAVAAVEAVEADDTTSPPTEAVEAVEAVEGVEAVAAIIGAEQRMRTAEEAFSTASVQLSQSQKNIANNQAVTAVSDLVYASMTAYAAMVASEAALARAQAFFDLLYADVVMIEQRREAVWQATLQAELDTAQATLGEKMATYDAARADMDVYLAQEQILKKAKAQAYNSTTPDQAAKDAADLALENHQLLLADLQLALDDATTERDNTQSTIDFAETERQNTAIAKELEARNKAFYDLEAQKANEESQVEQLQAEYDDWIHLRNTNAVDDELFDEFNARAEATLVTLNETVARLNRTTASYDVEEALKTTRDNEEAARQELQAFNERSAQRGQDYTYAEGLRNDAQTALDNNLSSIQSTAESMQEHLTNGGAESDDAYITMQDDRTALEDLTDGLRTEVTEIQNYMNSAQVNQAYDEQYVKKGLEYVAYENWQSGVALLESSAEDLAEALDRKHDMDKQLEAAQEELRLSTNQHEFSTAKDELDRVEGLYEEFMNGITSLQQTIEHLTSTTTGVEFLEGEYGRLRQDRQQHSADIENATGTALPDYDASQSPPEWVEPPELATAPGTAADTTTTDDSAATTDDTTTDGTV